MITAVTGFIVLLLGTESAFQLSLDNNEWKLTEFSRRNRREILFVLFGNAVANAKWGI